MMNKASESDHTFYWHSFKLLAIDYNLKTGKENRTPFLYALRLIDVMAQWDADVASAAAEAQNSAKEYLHGNAANFTRNFLETFSPANGFATLPCNPNHSFVLQLGLSVLENMQPPER